MGKMNWTTVDWAIYRLGLEVSSSKWKYQVPTSKLWTLTVSIRTLLEPEAEQPLSATRLTASYLPMSLPNVAASDLPSLF
jgi:hypothetical protein